MFLFVRHHNFMNLSMGHRAVSTGQFFLSFFCLLDIVWCLTDKFMKLQCPTDKNMMNNIY
jgi:hypothetical protein